MAPRPGRTPQQLSDASVHVHYEWYMVVATASTLAFPPRPMWPDPIRCGLLESFTVHARNLDHFFWSKKPKPRDVIAQDYFPAGAWTPPPHPPLFDTLRDEVATFIVHISYTRPNAGGEKQWPFGAMAIEFDDHMLKFQRDVERRDPALLSDEYWRRNYRVADRQRGAALLRSVLNKK